jgi:hypothetical protein
MSVLIPFTNQILPCPVLPRFFSLLLLLPANPMAVFLFLRLLFQSNDEFPFSANPTTRTPDLATLWPVVAQAQINLMNTSPIYSGLFALPKISLLL